MFEQVGAVVYETVIVSYSRRQNLEVAVLGSTPLRTVTIREESSDDVGSLRLKNARR